MRLLGWVILALIVVDVLLVVRLVRDFAGED